MTQDDALSPPLRDGVVTRGVGTEPDGREENIHLICPNCDAAMLDRGCKLLCERCGYFMGCSDYV